MTRPATQVFIRFEVPPARELGRDRHSKLQPELPHGSVSSRSGWATFPIVKQHTLRFAGSGCPPRASDIPDHAPSPIITHQIGSQPREIRGVVLDTLVRNENTFSLEPRWDLVSMLEDGGHCDRTVGRPRILDWSQFTRQFLWLKVDDDPLASVGRPVVRGQDLDDLHCPPAFRCGLPARRRDCGVQVPD